MSRHLLPTNSLTRFACTKRKKIMCCSTFHTMDGWMEDLRLYVLFNSILVISGRWLDDNERLCAMELRLRLERFLSQAGIEPSPARSVYQRLTHRATEAPFHTKVRVPLQCILP